jgi:hypothetical protein
VTAEEIERGIAEHTTLKLNFMDDKLALNKSNLFQRGHTFWNNQLMADPDVEFSEVIAEMCNSKKYMITPTLIMNSQGQMRIGAAEAYWGIVKGAKCTKWDIKHILYMPESNYNQARGYHGGLNGLSTDQTPVRPTVC